MRGRRGVDTCQEDEEDILQTGGSALHLVDDHMRHSLEVAVPVQPPQQHSGGAEEQPRLIGPP